MKMCFTYFVVFLGVYYIYAQINYLDEHDVNAFQIMVNENPFLLCTVMTHTGRSHLVSKANTCYTGISTYLTNKNGNSQ